MTDQTTTDQDAAGHPAPSESPNSAGAPATAGYKDFERITGVRGRDIDKVVDAYMRKEFEDPLFKKTSDDTSHVGQPGHDLDPTWTKFYAKYKEPCMKITAYIFPQWASETEDVFQRVVMRISKTPRVTKRKPNVKFRTVLCKLCIKEMRLIHTKHRDDAIVNFWSQSMHFVWHCLHPGKSLRGDVRPSIKDIIAYIREDLLVPGVENGPYYEGLDKTALGTWRLVQHSKKGMPGEIARKLKRYRSDIKEQTDKVNHWIKAQAKLVARDLDYMN